ncbi:MAG: AAA family ATPase [Magnetococcales bacterium]|nr:AAA family ATPase [Magnetococcales bacterium]HIJ83981.1 AAA family ATPase [Magnetococcales bacterium]
MYRSHFGLKELPFQITPDTDFLYFSRASQETLNVAMVALSFGEGFVKITGEVGTGKTLLCRKLLSMLGERNFVTAYLINPMMKPEDTYKAFAEEMGLASFDEAKGFQHFIKQITERLIELKQQGKNVVLFVDEAQTLTDETLEAIRLMTNLETEKQKILQVVLLGQPELDQRLENQYNLRQLRQRITFSSRLQPLDALEIRNYLNHRLQIAGHQGKDLFTPRAMQRLHRHSGGIPRLINILAHKSLMVAFGKGIHTVDVPHIAAAVADTEGLAAPGFRAKLQRWLPSLKFIRSKGPAAAVLLSAAAVHCQAWSFLS